MLGHADAVEAGPRRRQELRVRREERFLHPPRLDQSVGRRHDRAVLVLEAFWQVTVWHLLEHADLHAALPRAEDEPAILFRYVVPADYSAATTATGPGSGSRPRGSARSVQRDGGDGQGTRTQGHPRPFHERGHLHPPSPGPQPHQALHARPGPVGRGCDIVVEISAAAGLPDGMTIDEDGCLWVALYGRSAVHRYTPTGKLDAAVSFPVTNVTCPVFGGPGFGVLYVTSARDGLDERELAVQPHAGAVFAADVGAHGLPAMRFGG